MILRRKESSPATADNADRIEHAIDSAIDSIGMTRADWTPEQMGEITRRVSQGEPAVDVLEAMAQQIAEEPLSDTAQILLVAQDNSDIPFYDEAADETHGGTVFDARPGGEAGGVQVEGRDQLREPAADEQAVPRPGEGSEGRATEVGADGKPQLTILGTERESVADTAKRKADAPLKAKADQKLAMDDGLFGDGSKQTDHVDRIRTRGAR